MVVGLRERESKAKNTARDNERQSHAKARQDKSKERMIFGKWETTPPGLFTASKNVSSYKISSWVGIRYTMLYPCAF